MLLKYEVRQTESTCHLHVISRLSVANDNDMMYGSSVNEIWTVTDKIFCYFGRLTDNIFIFHFGLFTPPNDPKKQNSKFKIQNSKKKKKKTKKNPSADIIILHMCILNDNHMYGSRYVRLLV